MPEALTTSELLELLSAGISHGQAAGLSRRQLRRALYSLERSNWVEGFGEKGTAHRWLPRANEQPARLAFTFPVIRSPG